MQQIIDQVTNRLYKVVKNTKTPVSPEQLLLKGFQPFIVEHIRYLVIDKMMDDLTYPDTDWVAQDNKVIDASWNEFINSNIKHIQIPPNELFDIIENAVFQLLILLIEPRVHIPDLLFKSQTSLSYQEIVNRCEKITVHKQFATAIPLYMKKKRIDEISRERCASLVENLDERLISGFKPKDWAKRLEPLFTLLDDEVDTQLLFKYFKDNGRFKASWIFGEMDNIVSKEVFVKILDSEELKDLIGDKYDKSQSSDTLYEEFFNPTAREKTLLDTFLEIESEEDEDASIFENKPVEQTNNKEKKSVSKTEEKDDLNSLNSQFIEPSETPKKSKPSRYHDEEENEQLKKSISSLLGDAKFVMEEREEGEDKTKEFIDFESPVYDEDDKKAIEIPDSQSINLDDLKEDESDSDLGDDAPMWTRFLTPDQMDVLMKRRDDDDDEDNPVIDVEVSEDDGKSKSKKEDLKSFLSNQKTDFKKQIFKKTGKDYESSLLKLETFEEWEEAADYIENEIFTKNKVDLLSEIAVEFLDTTQNYFKAHK